ncbi:MAG TPA: C1 family peptidase [Pseudobacteroides sp.]|uniref:C1 family peptidase n=1 Tax=Pseudobacteroides sp. TaxID=1968840 RepID=UPI002F92AF41
MSNKLCYIQVGVMIFMVTAAAYLNSYIIVFSQIGEEGYIKNGLRETSDIEKNWAKRNVIVTRQINLNELAVDRINERRKDTKKGLLDKALAVNIGQEVEPNGHNILLEKYEGSSPNKISILDLPIHVDDLPLSVDNSKLDYFPPIRDQKPLGSCASFSSTYYSMTHMTALAKGWNVKDSSDNSNKFSPKWTYNMVNDGKDEGASIYGVYKALKEIGAATWEDVPYNSDYIKWSVDKDTWIKALSYKADKIGVIKDIDTDFGLYNLKLLLTNGYVLNFTTGLDSWKCSWVKDDPSSPLDDEFEGSRICFWADGRYGPHAMTIVGYNDNLWVDINNNGIVEAGEKGALRVANSWGTGWEDEGFSWIAYDALRKVSSLSDGPKENRNQAILGAQATWITAKNHYKPKLLAEITISHSKRNQMTFSLGYSDTGKSKPDKTLNSLMLSGNGGEMSFNGTKEEVRGTFVLDFTDLIDAKGLNINEKGRWYLKAGDSIKDANALSVLEFKLINPNAGEVISLDINNKVRIDGEDRLFWIDYGTFKENLSKRTITETSRADKILQVPAAVIVQTNNMVSLSMQVFAIMEEVCNSRGRILENAVLCNVPMTKVYGPARAPTS